MPRFRLTLAYDGTDFAGSQVQPNQRTVQGELERALGQMLGEPTSTTFAGRTDRGVHATGQVVAFDASSWQWDACALQRALNATLPDDLRATGARACDDAFHPRFDAAWREYRYWIAPGVVSPFLGRYAWTPRAGVELDLMAAGALHLVGTHDFASFAGGGEGVPVVRAGDNERAARRGRSIAARAERCRSFFGPGGGAGASGRSRGGGGWFSAAHGAEHRRGTGRSGAGTAGSRLDRRDSGLPRQAAGIGRWPRRYGLTLSAVGYGDEPIDDWQPATPGRREAHEGAV